MAKALDPVNTAPPGMVADDDERYLMVRRAVLYGGDIFPGSLAMHQPRLLAILFHPLLGLACIAGGAQCAAQSAGQSVGQSVVPPDAPSAAPSASASRAGSLRTRHAPTAEEAEAARIGALGQVNGRVYDQPSHMDQFKDYLRDSYGLPAMARSTVRTLYAEGRGVPVGWGQDFPGFMQRFGSNVAITAIDGNVRFGMETVFREDMRYIPCHGCSVKRKIMNALLAEVTARHDVDGHRFFTLTPAVADFSGPIIANYGWYPNHDPFGGVVGTRTVAATRVGAHLFTEFVLERRHHDRRIEDSEPLRTPPAPTPVPVAAPASAPAP